MTLREYEARYEAYRFMALTFLFFSGLESVTVVLNSEPGSFTWVLHSVFIVVAVAMALAVHADRRRSDVSEQV